MDVTPSYLQRRRGSKDAAGDEKSEWERRLDKPSVPLKAIGDPGPPKIVEIQEKYGAVEGKLRFTLGLIKSLILFRSQSVNKHYYCEALLRCILTFSH